MGTPSSPSVLRGDKEPSSHFVIYIFINRVIFEARITNNYEWVPPNSLEALDTPRGRCYSFRARAKDPTCSLGSLCPNPAGPSRGSCAKSMVMRSHPCSQPPHPPPRGSPDAGRNLPPQMSSHSHMVRVAECPSTQGGPGETDQSLGKAALL